MCCFGRIDRSRCSGRFLRIRSFVGFSIVSPTFGAHTHRRVSNKDLICRGWW
ncbi:hypothetical protein Mapa_008850 [Marchantia paleacea]|nr:hypothetical protein Mapa_008850 [Marchantia paleacea]